MEHHEYFRHFLNIEDFLVDYSRQLAFDRNSMNVYSAALSLLLLQTCPVIESYMVDLCTKSSTVKNSDLWGWQYNWKIWEKKNNKEEVKVVKGLRQIRSIRKFSYVCEKVFSISAKECIFYHYDKLQHLPTNKFTTPFRPYRSLSSFIDYKDIDTGKANLALGTETPDWWTAYNKIKHNLDLSKRRVRYQLVIEAIGALLIVLIYAEPDVTVLENNDYLKLVNGKKVVKTKLFQCQI